MNDQKRIQELEQQLAERDQVIAEQARTIVELREQIIRLGERLATLEGQRQKDRHNSSKPPSSDGVRRRPYAQRPASTKKTGGQPGHEGHTLERSDTPEVIIEHRPAVCATCQHSLTDCAGTVVAERQVVDIPPPARLFVTAHRREEVTCPHCGNQTAGTFPAEVEPGVQYGPEVRTMAVYLYQYQFLSLERTCEAMNDLVGVSVSEGTVSTWVQLAAERVAPSVQRIADLITTCKQMGGDETGIRIAGQTRWLHVASTRWLTHLAWHRKRGREAMRDIGIWPRFFGKAMHDRWASYDTFACQHRLCKAHLIRDLTYLAEVEKQAWAEPLRECLLDMHDAAHEWQARGVARFPEDERADWLIQYFTLIGEGFATVPKTEPVPNHPGKAKQHPAKNLLDVLLHRAEQILGFVEDTSEDFTNHRREQDIRMVKVHEKISGGFRSEAGATACCAIRSYVSTLRKQGHRAFAIIRSIFQHARIPIVWSME